MSVQTSMKKQMGFALIALALLAAGGAWLFFRPGPSSVPAEPAPAAASPLPSNPTTIANFRREGYLTGGDGAWTFTYEEPGKPGLVVRLEFNAASRCGEPSRLCAEFPKSAGLRVYIEGIKSSDMLNVGILRPIL